MQTLIVLTRPEAKNKALASSLRSKKFEVLSLPALIIHPYSWEDLSSTEQKTLQEFSTYDAVFFVSSSAIDCFFNLMQTSTLQIDLHKMVFFCVGKSSFQHLLTKGICADQILFPQHGNDSEALYQRLQQEKRHYQRVLILRGDTGREWFGKKLQSQGCEVKYLSIYRREARKISEEEKKYLQSFAQTGRIQWLWTSTQSVQALLPSLYELGVFDALHQSEHSNHFFIVIHPKIGQYLRELLAQLSQGKIHLSDTRIQCICAENTAIIGALDNLR